MDFFGERAQAPGEGIDGHRRGEVGGFQQFIESMQREHAGGQHLRGAVVQRQAFLVRQRHRLQTRALERSRTGHALAGEERFATTEQHDRQVRQRREVARRADRAQLRDDRHDARVEHRRQRLQRLDADAGVAAQQRVDADAQHGAHDVRRERRRPRRRHG